MNIFERIIYALQKEIETPVSFGLYHLCCLTIVILLTIWLCIRFRDANDKTVRRILCIAWACMLIAEIYKQIVFSMDVTNGIAEWSYSWYSFPYQFCSTPLYVLPLAVFCRGRIQKSALVYLATFSLFGGLAVMIYPGDVFIRTLGVDIQTMLHHGLQVIIGIFLAVHSRKKLSLRHFLRAVPLFVVAVGIALGLNLGVYHAFAARDGDIPTFNMFFISPYFDCTLPIVGSVYGAVPYPVFLLVYILGFCTAALAVYFAVLGIYRLCLRRKKV